MMTTSMMMQKRLSRVLLRRWVCVGRRRWFGSLTHVVLPTLGDSITEGQVVEYTKHVGDRVDVDDVVAIIETDKVSVDVRSEVAGVVAELMADVGANVPVGANLLSISDDGVISNADSTPPPPPPPPPPPQAAPAAAETAAAVAVVVPSMGDSITEGEVSVLMKGVGDAVDVDEVIMVLETDKVSVDVRAAVAGVVSSVLVEEGAIVAIGQILVEISPGTAAASSASASSSSSSSSLPPPPKTSTTPTTASASSSPSPPPHRSPLIRFRHGTGNKSAVAAMLSSALSGGGAVTGAAAAAAAADIKVHGLFATLRLSIAPVHGADFTVPPQYQRAPLSDEQIDAINSGMSMEA